MTTAKGGHGKRILVCDDERHIARLLQVNLTRQGGEVVCTYSGGEAISALKRETFDLAIVDHNLRDMSGDDLLFWIRSNERTRDLRVVMLDGDRRDDEDPPGPMAGATLWLAKPFNPSWLLDL